MKKRLIKVFTTVQPEFDTVTLTLHLNNEPHNTVHEIRLSHSDKDVLILSGIKIDDLVEIRDAIEQFLCEWTND
ncbi:MAG: hypothetical protein WC679_01410 [Bacteroidales bacterium]|jgi:hypothetical protein